MPFTSENATLTTASDALDMLTGREYLRVSQDNSGRQRSVTEQHNDNERTTARHNIVITGAPYVDNDRSASRYASKARDDWARLVADLESGAFTEDVLILWENSRYSRKTSEWLYLMELCEEHGKKIFITSDNRLYDLTHWKDRRNLREDASDSETESDKVSMRNRRTSASEAEKGRPKSTGWRTRQSRKCRRNCSGAYNEKEEGSLNCDPREASSEADTATIGTPA